MNLYVNTPFEWCQRCKAFKITEEVKYGLRNDGNVIIKAYMCDHWDLCKKANHARMEWEEENE